MHRFLIGVAALGSLTAGLIYCQDEKVAFVKGGELWTASMRAGAIANLVQLTRDKREKHMPEFSPDGTRVLYFQAETRTDAIGALIVGNADGSFSGKYSLATVTEAGIVIDGMHTVDTVGWVNSGNIFAEGNVNPYINEFRKIDLKTGHFESYGGFGFSVCADNGAIAYWRPVRPQSDTMDLATSLSTVPLFKLPSPNSLLTLHVPITWGFECTTLAFVDSRPPKALIVVTRSAPHASRVDIPPGVEGDSILCIRDTLVVGSRNPVIYAADKGDLNPAPSYVIETIKAIEANTQARRGFEHQLGASEADWWPRKLY